MRQLAYLRNHYRNSLSPVQRRNRWLFCLLLAFVALTTNRCSTWYARTHAEPTPMPLGKLV